MIITYLDFNSNFAEANDLIKIIFTLHLIITIKFEVCMLHVLNTPYIHQITLQTSHHIVPKTNLWDRSYKHGFSLMSHLACHHRKVNMGRHFYNSADQAQDPHRGTHAYSLSQELCTWLISFGLSYVLWFGTDGFQTYPSSLHTGTIQYISETMHMLCCTQFWCGYIINSYGFVWHIYTYSSGLLQPWRICINVSDEAINIDDITKTKLSATKHVHSFWDILYLQSHWAESSSIKTKAKTSRHFQ